MKLTVRGGRQAWIMPSKVNAVGPAAPAAGDIVDGEGVPVPYSCVALDFGGGFVVVGDPDVISNLLFPPLLTT